MVIIGMLIVQCYIVIVPEILEIYEYTVYKFKKKKIDEIDDYAYL